jgi:hypothetical protein
VVVKEAFGTRAAAGVEFPSGRRAANGTDPCVTKIAPWPDQIPDAPVITHRDMQVAARNGEIRVLRRSPHLCQRAFAGQGVADERVPPVMDGERAEAR